MVQYLNYIKYNNKELTRGKLDIVLFTGMHKSTVNYFYEEIKVIIFVVVYHKDQDETQFIISSILNI